MVAVYSSKAKIKPSDNIILSGRDLMEEIPQYRQVKVSGRGLVGREIDTTTIPGRPGVRVNFVHEKPIELEVDFILDCSSAEEVSEAFKKLNKILRKDEILTIRFADTPSYYYKGYYTSAGNVNQNGYLVQSSFTLFIPYPYMMSNEKTSTRNISLLNADKVLPNIIIAKVTKNTEEISLTNGRNTIRLIGHYEEGKTLAIQWTPTGIVVNYDGRSALTELALLSAPEDFYLRDGDTISGINLNILQVKWEEERQ